MLVNSRLAPFSLYLLLLGPMLVIPALSFKSPSLILCSFITGLSIDALLPQPYGLFVYGLPVIGLLVRSIRSHFRTETSYRFVLLAHMANLACIVLLSVSQGIYFGQISASLIQILVITLLSHTMLCIVAPWFFSFERLLLQFLNIEHAHEDEFSAL
ncbi:MAG: cell shape-determining protein MreD [Lentimonas sp.]|jgi:cell shape-determining protein MreD